MKKLLFILLTLAMAISLFACGDKDKKNENPQLEASATTQCALAIL